MIAEEFLRTLAPYARAIILNVYAIVLSTVVIYIITRLFGWADEDEP